VADFPEFRGRGRPSDGRHLTLIDQLVWFSFKQHGEHEVPDGRGRDAHVVCPVDLASGVRDQVSAFKSPMARSAVAVTASATCLPKFTDSSMNSLFCSPTTTSRSWTNPA
jgi:hypothetical protein